MSRLEICDLRSSNLIGSTCPTSSSSGRANARHACRCATSNVAWANPPGRWADTLRDHFLSACREIDTEGEEAGEPGQIAWFPDRTFAGRTYIPAVARTSEGYELFGFVSFSEAGGGPTDFDARADFTSELAEANPDWKLDLNDDVIGAWRGDEGRTADITLVWGVPLMPGGRCGAAA